MVKFIKRLFKKKRTQPQYVTNYWGSNGAITGSFNMNDLGGK